MSSEPMPIQFRDGYTMTRRASEEFLSAFAAGKHMICGVEAQCGWYAVFFVIIL